MVTPLDMSNLYINASPPGYTGDAQHQCICSRPTQLQSLSGMWICLLRLFMSTPVALPSQETTTTRCAAVDSYACIAAHTNSKLLVTGGYLREARHAAFQQL